MKILLTGHNGFLGRAVSHELMMRHHWLRLFSGDVRNEADVVRQVRHQDLVVHLAAKTPGKGFSGLPIFASHNTHGSITVAEACSQFEVPLIYCGSRVTDGPYGRSKAMAEQVLRDEFAATVVRVSMAYGPGQEPPGPWAGGPVRLIPTWICAALSGEPIRILGDPDSVPDLVYVDDVADAFSGLVDDYATTRRLPSEIEVAGPGEHSLMDVAELVAAEVCRQKKRPVQIDASSARTCADPPPGRPGHGTPLAVGLRRTVSYYRAVLDL